MFVFYCVRRRVNPLGLTAGCGVVFLRVRREDDLRRAVPARDDVLGEEVEAVDEDRPAAWLR